ncbi:MAG: DUF3631 domain-containing protein, partial [Deltaproteobacteria bacterium]|nr:DUF3631 domain-containing protein [Deltaproteobacteria bacterium]
GRTTAAALARKVDRDSPTLLLDESDAAFGGEREYAETPRGILNSGHRRGATVSLCAGKGSDQKVVELQTFCPKAIAGIGRLPDTVDDRSVPVVLRRRTPQERIERLRRRHVEDEVRALRERLARWAASITGSLRDSEPEIPDELGDRQADAWEPLLAIADLFGKECGARARVAALVLSARRAADDESLGARLLLDVQNVFSERDVDRLTSKELVAALTELEESPWEPERGHPFDERRLAARLRPYDIRPEKWRKGTRTERGYHAQQFLDAWARYLPERAPQPPQAPQAAYSRSDSAADASAVAIPVADDST